MARAAPPIAFAIRVQMPTTSLPIIRNTHDSGSFPVPTGRLGGAGFRRGGGAFFLTVGRGAGRGVCRDVGRFPPEDARVAMMVTVLRNRHINT
ncbi:hypothetical protein Hesp01_01520 [Herbidospora sp. NBRC 101105]|nr:hypothetical protein Hesp01_01520 [Herbidospora sp. NBRC 101105]